MNVNTCTEHKTMFDIAHSSRSPNGKSIKQGLVYTYRESRNPHKVIWGFERISMLVLID